VTPTFPAWLHVISIASLFVAVVSAAVVAVDETRRRQHMWVMNLVWPLCTLFGSLVWLAFYFRSGRGMTPAEMSEPGDEHGGGSPMWVAVAKGSSHCGAGCALGDILAETLVLAVPSVALLFGWKTVFGEKMFAVWVLDYLVAFGLGVVFQYFAIAPMRQMSVREGLLAALKADAASITAWQVGMYGFMAVAQFLVFRPMFGAMATAAEPEFWFAMQLAMLCGFATSYPVNWLLVRTGVKERM
jgi:hypothetical protein